jgi:hypothetical protein
MTESHGWQLVPGMVVDSPSFGRGVVTFASAEYVHVQTSDTVAVERADGLEFPPVRRLDGVLVRAGGDHHRLLQTDDVDGTEKLESGVVCQEEPERVFVLLARTQESVWVDRAHVRRFEVVGNV